MVTVDKKKVEELYWMDMSDREIAAMLGICKTTVMSWRHKAGLPSKPEKIRARLDAGFMELYEKGMTDKEIGEAVNVETFRVRLYRNEKGLPKNGADVETQDPICKDCGAILYGAAPHTARCKPCAKAHTKMLAEKREQGNESAAHRQKRIRKEREAVADIVTEAREKKMTYGQYTAPKVEVNIPYWAKAKRVPHV